MLRSSSLCLVLVVAFLPAGIFAQNISDYFTPYGFQTPNLQKGEYLLSLWGGYYDSGNRLKLEDPQEISRSSNLRHYFSMRALYGVTDIFLIRLQAYFYPSRIASESESNFDGTIPYYRLSRQIPSSYLQPSIELVFKPKPAMEIYGSVNFYSYDYAARDYSSPSDPDYIESEYHYSYKSFTLGINYLGKL